MSGRLVLDVATPPKGQRFPGTTYEPTLRFHFIEVKRTKYRRFAWAFLCVASEA